VRADPALEDQIKRRSGCVASRAWLGRLLSRRAEKKGEESSDRIVARRGEWW
jgi:hypothetical protein